MFKVVVFDLDETLWTSYNGRFHASLLKRPLRKLNEQVIVDSENKKLRLRSNTLETLRKLKQMGLTLSVISANDEDICLEILQQFGILSYFQCPQIAWKDREAGTCDKGELMKALVLCLRNSTLPELTLKQILFVDDRKMNVDRVRQLGATTLQFGVDIDNISDVLNYLKVIQ